MDGLAQCFVFGSDHNNSHDPKFRQVAIPIVLSLAHGTANLQFALASARISIGVGRAILISQLLLGWFADQLDL